LHEAHVAKFEKIGRIMKLALVALGFIATPASAAAPVTGKWMTGEKDSIVEIGPCGNAVCGRITRILKPGQDGSAPIDKLNPDPALRNRSVVGLMVLTGFMPDGDAWKGRIYNPRAGKTYKSYLARNPDGSLKVKGCVGPMCKEFTWTAMR